jgi:hypothetical protein
MWWRRLRYLLLLTALCSIATCPSAKRACVANTRAKEADMLMDYLVTRITTIYQATGRLPPTAAGPTPVPGCCERGGGTCAADVGLWQTAGWRELGFSIDDEYVPDPQGTSAVIRVVGDLDCDEIKSLYEVKLVVVTPSRILVRTSSRKEASE